MRNFRTKIEKYVFIPDIHFPYHDMKSLSSLFKFIVDFKPDVIVQLGDLVDFYDLSTYSKEPSRINTLQQELDMGKWFWNVMSDLAPTAKKYMKAGNHEDRLSKFLCKNPSIAVLNDLNIENLLRLDKNNVKYHHTGDHLVFHEDTKPLLVMHGKWTNKYSAMAHLEKMGVCGVSGHTHRASKLTKTNFSGEIQWLECGFLGSLKGEGFGFVKDGIANWSQAFGVGVFDGSNWHLQLVDIKDNKFVYGGKLYVPQ